MFSMLSSSEPEGRASVSVIGWHVEACAIVS